jgi:hypothetical protein
MYKQFIFTNFFYNKIWVFVIVYQKCERNMTCAILINSFTPFINFA